MEIILARERKKGGQKEREGEKRRRLKQRQMNQSGGGVIGFPCVRRELVSFLQ